VRFIARTAAPPEVLARAATLAWLDGDVLELDPSDGLEEINANAKAYVEKWAAVHLRASVTWQGFVAEFTPDYDEAAA
jgi:hypothetical protein